MNKPKVGFMSVSCPTHIKAYDELGRPWVESETTDRVVNALQISGLEIIEYPEVIVSIQSSLGAVNKFRESNVDCVIIFIDTWNWANQIVQAAREVNLPLILWAIPLPAKWSIGGLAVTHGSLDESGIEHEVVYGFPEDDGVMDKILNYSSAAMVINSLKRSRYGSIGGPGMGIYTGIVPANQWLKEFGISVGFTDQYTVVVEAEKVSRKEVEDYYEELKKDYNKIPPLDEIMERSIKLYFGLKKIIKEEGYNFTGVKCTFDLSDNYCSACLGQSRLGKEGFPTACLSDANGALTMYIMRLLTDEPLFMADVNLINKKEKTIRLIDDGAAAPQIAKSKDDVELDYQPRLEAKASGICTNLIAKPGRVTLSRLSRVDGKYHMHIVEGEAYDAPKELKDECGYPFWPHCFVRLNADMDKFIQNLRSEYIHMAYGNLKPKLMEVCKLLKIIPDLS